MDYSTISIRGFNTTACQHTITDPRQDTFMNETIREKVKETLRQRICLVGSVIENENVQNAAKVFNVPVVTSETGKEFISDSSWMTFFVISDFEGPIYEEIYKSKTKHKILGPPAIIAASSDSEGLPLHNRPIYNYSMRNCVTAFSGIRKRDELTQIIHLIHSMGGSIRKEMNHRATHLICSNAYGEKYRYALTFRLNVIKSGWVLDAWRRKDEPGFSAKEDIFTAEHRLKIFEGCRVAFIGFNEKDHASMVNLLELYNGTETSSEDETCTHKVVEDKVLHHDQGMENPKYYVVKAEWFWTRIAEGYAPEDDFLYKNYMQSIKEEQAEQSERRDSLINYSAKAQRKRKRLSWIDVDGTPASAGKRRSSISDAGILSESLIDYTASPVPNDSVKEDAPREKFTMRRNHFMDFYHTESNYVGILETIFKLFKVPLEKLAEGNPEQSDLLNKSEVKAIFSNYLPIYQVHKKMLNSLQDINARWSEDSSIGQIILENRDCLLKAYPPYINSFEQMKATLLQCAQSKPRFQAFLKINQAKPECGRQSLQELMIRPVQRLPSISLLLNDILKHTPKNNRDHEFLLEALKAIKEVMTYINEDKRKTESQTQMFNIFNEIENCPPHLVSSHRSFISRCEVTELSEILSGRGDSLLLFLFTDTLEICKKRSRFNNTKSPPTSRANIKPYKHIKLIPLSTIRTLADISENQRAFAVFNRTGSNMQDTSKDKIYAFSITDEDVNKSDYIRSLSKQLADNACRTDSEKFVISVQSQEIGIDINGGSHGTLSKAFRLATRTRLRVGRALSFSSKTPSKKRNIESSFGSNISITPTTSSMRHLKLQQSSINSSCVTLNNYAMDRNDQNNLFQDKIENVAPYTDQMPRKNVKRPDCVEEM